MDTNGYVFRKAIRRWERRKDAALLQFPDNFHQFEGENKTSPEDLSKEIENCSTSIARLRAFQHQYNNKVTVLFEGNTIKLDEAIGLVGSLGHLANLWKAAAGGDQNHRSYRAPRSKQRVKDDEYAKRTVTVQDCLKEFANLDQRADDLREQISISNSLPQEFEDLDLALLE